MLPYQSREIRHLGALLLDVGAMLMSAGANTARIRITINRICMAYGYSADLFITHQALTLSLADARDEDVFNRSKRTPPHGVNFKLVSGISRMSWRVVDEQWTIAMMRKELQRLAALSPYPRFIVLLMVGLAGAAFCRLSGGCPIEMLVAFSASLLGLVVRQEAHVRRFNPYLCVFLAAASASLVLGAFMRLEQRVAFEHAFATSVLFLVPGVPLLNAFSDLVDGNFLTGLSRMTHGLIISFCIALGLLTAIVAYGFQA